MGKSNSESVAVYGPYSDTDSTTTAKTCWGKKHAYGNWGTLNVGWIFDDIQGIINFKSVITVLWLYFLIHIFQRYTEIFMDEMMLLQRFASK